MPISSTVVDSTSQAGTTVGTTCTVTGCAGGSAFAGRVLVAVLFTASGNAPSAVTIFGIAAVVTGSATTGQFIASAVVPTGTTGSIVATVASSDHIVYDGMIALAGAKDATQTASSNVASGSNTIAVPAGGTVVAYANTYPATTAGSWSGVNSAIGYNSSHSTATGDLDNPGAAIPSLTVSYSNGTFLNLATFSPLVASYGFMKPKFRPLLRR